MANYTDPSLKTEWRDTYAGEGELLGRVENAVHVSERLAGNFTDAFNQRVIAARDAMEEAPAPVGRDTGWRLSGMLPRWLGYGAALAVISIVAGKSILQMGHDTDSKSEVREYVTAKGQRAELRLLDGTVVHLNSASRLRVPNDFGRVTRSIELTGEALFSVAQSVNAPFIVRTNTATTRVLGTEFDVRSYPEEQGARIVVTSGRVAVGNAVLAAGDVGSGTEQSIKVVHNADIASLLAWHNGALQFRNEPMRNVIRELERWYDIEIHMDKVFDNVQFTGAFETEAIDEAMGIVSRSLSARAQRHGRTVTIQTVAP